MALRALLLRKKIDHHTAELEKLRARSAEMETREAELEAAANELTAESTEEERSTLDAEVETFEQERSAHQDQIAAVEAEIENLRSQLAEEESRQDTTPPAPAAAPAETERRENNTMLTATRARIFGNMTVQERSALCARPEVASYLSEVRSAIAEKRALTNVGVTIPDVLLQLLRENLIDYSKLYRHVNVQQVRGTARQPIMGTIPEAIWTDCCANLNELTLAFYDLEMDCYRVAGYFAVCNANMEDSDLDLTAELIDAIDKAIGLALDKAILYGRNSNTAMKMPLGIVSRLAQTAQPAGYPATARPWADLHTSNILSIDSDVTGVEFFRALALASGAAKGKYSRGEKVWVMNETTYTGIVAEAMSVDAGGAIVSGVNGTMPVIGGIIEVLDFVPDNVIIGGYFDLYTLAERRGPQFATSEHVRFLQDQTVMKGTARYDGAPAIAEAFVAIGTAGNTPAASAVTFAADTANAG